MVVSLSSSLSLRASATDYFVLCGVSFYFCLLSRSSSSQVVVKLFFFYRILSTFNFLLSTPNLFFFLGILRGVSASVIGADGDLLTAEGSAVMELDCQVLTNGRCEQHWVIDISIHSSELEDCTIDGTFTLILTLECTDDQNEICDDFEAGETLSVLITLASANVCTEVHDDIQTEGTLKAYDDEQRLGEEASIFEWGEMLYLVAEVESRMVDINAVEVEKKKICCI